MKSLQDFILENVENIDEAKSSKSFTFNLKDIEGAEEALKTLSEMAEVTVDEDKVTVNVSEENKDALQSFTEFMSKFVTDIRKSTRNSSDEQYAQKTHAIADKFDELKDYIDELSVEPKEDDDKKEDDKEEDKEKDDK